MKSKPSSSSSSSPSPPSSSSFPSLLGNERRLPEPYDPGNMRVRLRFSRQSSLATTKIGLRPANVRPYVRSKTPRLRWTPSLHYRFLHAVESLGGEERATPKMVLQIMGVSGLTISHVKSHLQMYRNMKQEQMIQEIMALEAKKRETTQIMSRLDCNTGYNSNHHQYCSSGTDINMPFIDQNRGTWYAGQLSLVNAADPITEWENLMVGNHEEEQQWNNIARNVTDDDSISKKPTSYIIFRDILRASKPHLGGNAGGQKPTIAMRGAENDEVGNGMELSLALSSSTVAGLASGVRDLSLDLTL